MQWLARASTIDKWGALSRLQCLSSLWQRDLKTALLSEPVKLRRDFPKWSDKGAPENRSTEGIPYTPFPFSSLEGGFRIVKAEEVGAVPLVFLEGAAREPWAPLFLVGGAKTGLVAKGEEAAQESEAPLNSEFFLVGMGVVSPAATLEWRLEQLSNLALHEEFAKPIGR